MRQIDFLADTLPVVELTATGVWVTLGEAHGVSMSRYRRGKGFCWTGAWKQLALAEPDEGITVLRWQTDKIIARRSGQGG